MENDPKFEELLKDFNATRLYYYPEDVEDVTLEDWYLMKEKYNRGDFNIKHPFEIK